MLNLQISLPRLAVFHHDGSCTHVSPHFG
jgi:hypothetical protein